MSDMYEVTGTIHALGQTLPAGNKQKREVVLVLDGDTKYPQYVAFEAFGDKVDYLDKSRVGDDVAIKFELRGREWRKNPGDPVKFFTALGLRSLVTIKAAPEPIDGAESLPF